MVRPDGPKLTNAPADFEKLLKQIGTPLPDLTAWIVPWAARAQRSRGIPGSRKWNQRMTDFEHEHKEERGEAYFTIAFN
jgi:hypothetical protein